MAKTSIKPYRLLGVDPGTNVLGYAVIEVLKDKMTLVEMGVVKMKHLEEHSHKLKKIFERIKAIIHTHKPREMAIEAPFYGKNPQSMLKLGRAQGVAIAAAVTSGIEITEYSPKKIKQSVTGSGNASKEQVAAMLENILNTTLEQTTFDATDALAAAVCHYFQTSSLLGKSRQSGGWKGFLRDNPDRIS